MFVYVERVYNEEFHVKMFVSKADPSRLVIENVKSVGQVAVNSVELTARSENVCTSAVLSIT